MITDIEQANEFIFNYNWYESRSRNQEQEIEALRNCEALAIEHQQYKLLFRTRAYMTSYYTHINNLIAALEIGNQNYKDCTKQVYTDELLMTLSFLITIHQILGNYSQSEMYINICKEYIYKLDDIKKRCNIHIVAAVQYNYTGDTEKCISENEQALKYANILNDNYTLITIYNNYAYQILEKNTDKAKKMLDDGMILIEEHSKTNPQINYLLAHYFLNYANLYNFLQDADNTILFAQKAMYLHKEYDAVDSYLEAETYLADAYLFKKQYDKCFQHLQNIKEVASSSSSNTILLKCFKLFHRLYEEQAQYQKAHEYLKKYIEIKDIIFNQESEKAIRNLQITHETKTITLQKENAEHIAQLKQDFLANMSHEIRTPINSIIGICYLLHQDNLSEKQEAYVTRLERSGENLLGLINDILDISKIEAGKLEFVYEPKFISEILENVYNALIFQANKKGIELQLKIDLPKIAVLTDSTRLIQILTNLVSNAIKFTTQGSVTIAAKLVGEAQNPITVDFRIIDTGIGISAEKINTIFSRYEQANAFIQKQFGGTGLGLSISKKITEMMNGSIALESTEGVGTTFILQMPFTLSENDSSLEVLQLDTSIINHKSILIADDIEEQRLILREILQNAQQDIKILEAENGIEAIECTHAEHPDIILMDLDMAEMDGIEATSIIKKNPKYKNIKIIATTASLVTLSKEELFDLGFDDLILKPLRPQILLQQMVKLFTVKEE
jgi:signal transduction histidine kinase